MLFNDDRWMTATHFEKIGARRIFPCWDKPEYKTTFNISVKHHNNYSVISNMPVQKTEEEEDMLWTYFSTTPPMSTYLVALVVVERLKLFNFVDTFAPINIWCKQDSRLNMYYAGNIISNLTMYMKNKWDKGYLNWKVDHIAFPIVDDEDMKSFGLVIYR